jgi:hypothetical protein
MLKSWECTFILNPGANPTIASYNATGSLAGFDDKNMLFFFENAVSYYNAGVVALYSKVIGLAPDIHGKVKTLANLKKC